MDDKSCRLQILRRLKLFYDGDPHALVQKGTLWAGITVTGPELDRNVKYLQEKSLVGVNWAIGGEFIAQITAEGIDFLETGQPAALAIQSPVNIQQVFHGPVGGVAGRDINIQISFNEVLNKLSESVEASQTIPPVEKLALLDKIKSLAGNGWIQSIGTSVLAELIKKSVGL